MDFWTHEHLVTLIPTLIFMILASLLMRKLLINKPYRVRMIPIQVMAVLIIILEIGKQTFSILNGYDLYHIPLHFCSIFIYVLPLMAFYRGKGEDGVRSVACSAMLSLFFGMLIIPNVIYSNSNILSFFDNYFSFHTVFFHNLVIFALFTAIALDLHKPSGKPKEVLFIFIFASSFVILAGSASYLLDTNFSNFLYSTVGLVKELTEKMKLAIGETLTAVIYTSTLAILHILLLIIANYLFLLICSLTKRKDKEKLNH